MWQSDSGYGRLILHFIWWSEKQKWQIAKKETVKTFFRRFMQVYVSVDDLMPNDSQLSGIRTWTSSVVPATAPWLDNAGQTASWLDVIAA